MEEIKDSCHVLARMVGDLLLNTHRTLTTVESCTGGGIAYTLTSVPGCSAWFETGFVTYSNDAKMNLVGVSEDLLTSFGAVSEQVAEAMASGALTTAGADYAVSVTGIAGPDGGSEAKPVGMVCFGWVASDGLSKVDTRIFPEDRDSVRTQSIVHALDGLRKILEEKQARNI